MKRNIMKELISWKNNRRRKPLIIEGARQVGKTWVMKEFGRACYRQTVYFNFDINKPIGEIFKKNIEPRHIIGELEILSGAKIESDDTLIIFDEIQECNRALVSLKYFCEEAPEYHIIAAGSLLGVAIHKDNSFPVGKVDILRLYPLSFIEFLDALGELRYQVALDKKNWSSFYLLEAELIRALKQYYFVGGMPEAVRSYIENRNFNEVRRIQEGILHTLERDFSKHINAPSIPKVGMIWNSVPAQLAKEKKQFIYRDMKEGGRASQFEDALYWLERIGLIYRVNRVSVPLLPLAAYEDGAFKLYMLDIGLLSAKAGLSVQTLVEPDTELFNHFRGALTEQFVLQELTANTGTRLYYWANDRKKGNAELDFIMQHEGEIIPIEVKASLNLKAKSLKVYMDYYHPGIAIRSSLAAYSRNGPLCDIPLYLIGQFRQIIAVP
jgi:predicted AAA+ superfamily ATPase